MLENPFLLIFIAVGFFAIQVVTLVVIFQMRKKLKVALLGKEGQSIEAVLEERFNDLKRLQFSHSDLENRIVELEKIGKKSFQKSALVRYSAFDHNGVQQSFSLALLDNTNSGFVLSALFGQEKSRLYFKQVKGGKSGQGITQEEQQAINEAIAS